MKDVLKALDKCEKVRILYHGKVKGTIIPAQNKSGKKIFKHPFFGMREKESASVDKRMDELRKDRYDVV